MQLSRREALGLAATGVALAGCAPFARRFAHHPEHLPLPAGDVHPALRTLTRTGFGPRPGDVARLRQQGFPAYLDEQLRADRSEQPALLMQLQRLDVLQIDDPDLQGLPLAEVMRQLQQAALLRAVYGNNQLLERLCDFWSNHFNIYARKGNAAFRKGADETHVIRDHALGKFPELLWASAHSPAMLAYLDNTQNLRQHPNENYARELMELHTLGIGGGYTQKDVQEVARCFTGWFIEDRFLRKRGKIRFESERHDDGPKLVLGRLIPAGGGETDVPQVLAILSSHPSTARFISKKLVRYFHGQDDSKLTEAVAACYTQTGGDIPSMLRLVLEPRALAEAPPVLKRPFDYIVSAIRAGDGDTDGSGQLQDHLSAMGEPLYQWPMPDGYPVKTAAWTGNMLPRWNFAHALAHDQIGGTSLGQVDDPLEATLNRHRQAEDSFLAQAVRGASDKEAVALCLASPEFQWS